MKEKLITIILTILILVVPTIFLPTNQLYDLPKIIALLFLGVMLLILFLCNYKKISIDKKDILLIVFAILIFLSSIFSSDFKTSLLGAKIRYEGMLTFFTYIIIYLCTKKFFKYKNIKTLLIVLYGLFIIICTYGILQYYLNGSLKHLQPVFGKGVCGTFGNTNFMGSFLSLGIPIFSMIFVTKGDKISFITSLLTFFCLLACTARSAWIAFVFFTFTFLVYLIENKNKKIVIRTIILILSFVLIFIYQYSVPNSILKSKTNKLWSDIKTVLSVITNTKLEDETVNKLGSSRVFIWKETIRLIKKHPVLGVGTDNLEDGIFNNLTPEMIEFMINKNLKIDKAHNEYLHIAVTIGIPALITYVTFLLMVLYKRKKIIFKSTTFFILYSSIFSYLVQAFFNISVIGIAPLFWFALGLMDNKMINENNTN